MKKQARDPMLLGRLVKKWYEQKSPKSIRIPSELADASPDIQTLAQLQLRGQQAKQWADIADLAGIGALAGGGLGLVGQLPKLLALNKVPDSRKRRKREEHEPKHAAALTFPGGKSAIPPSAELSTPSNLPGLAGRAGFWPLAPLAVGGAVIGTNALVDYVTDKLRKHELESRRKELQEEFNTLLSEGIDKPSELRGIVDALGEKYAQTKLAGADTGSSSATLKPSSSVVDRLTTILRAAPGLAATLAGVGLAGGLHAGMSLRKKVDPNRIRKLTLEHALLRRRMEGSPSLRLIPVPPEEAGEEAGAGASPAEVPIVLPPITQAKTRRPSGDYDSALDLSKAAAPKWLESLQQKGTQFGHQVQGFGRTAKGVVRAGKALADIKPEQLSRAAETFNTVDFDRINRLNKMVNTFDIDDMEKRMQQFQQYMPLIDRFQNRFPAGRLENIYSRMDNAITPVSRAYDWGRQLFGHLKQPETWQQAYGGYGNLGNFGQYMSGGGQGAMGAIKRLLGMLGPNAVTAQS